MRDFQLPGRSAVFAMNGMAATSHPLAAKVAVQMLESGGNAVDAAIAGAVLLQLCEPMMTGIGGDCFVLLQPPGTGKVVALNGSGRAPSALSGADLRGRGLTEMPLSGPHSVTIPGAIDALCLLSRDWGRIGLKSCLAPAIHYAEAGVPVSPRTAFDWRKFAPRLEGDARKFLLIADKPPGAGQVYRSPQLAEVLRLVAMEGRRGFYEGAVAEDMVASLSALGGVHQLDDFAANAPEYTTPLIGNYRGIELLEHPPNGQGATALLLANILAEFDIGALDPLGSQRAHIEAEATKLAFDARNRFVADADHAERLDHMLAPETARDLAALIDPARAMASPASLAGAVHKDTVYITVVDRDRMAVSLIYSIFHGFGSGIASARYGINFHNRGAGFNLSPGHANEAAGGKRPMHTIIPGMLGENGRVFMPFGVMGGAYQPTGHVRFLSNMVDYGMHPQKAIDAPRCFAENGVLRIETGYPERVRRKLAEMGHRIEVADSPIGGAQAIRMDHQTGVLEGASDPRKDGCALGY